MVNASHFETFAIIVLLMLTFLIASIFNFTKVYDVSVEIHI